jgi:DNA polymerase III subunit delta'
LTDPPRGRRLAAWFDAANRARELLRTTVRADLVLVEVLLAWREAAAGREGRG